VPDRHIDIWLPFVGWWNGAHRCRGVLCWELFENVFEKTVGYCRAQCSFCTLYGFIMCFQLLCRFWAANLLWRSKGWRNVTGGTGRGRGARVTPGSARAGCRGQKQAMPSGGTHPIICCATVQRDHASFQAKSATAPRRHTSPGRWLLHVADLRPGLV
jgi:hypothetical protein